MARMIPAHRSASSVGWVLSLGLGCAGEPADKGATDPTPRPADDPAPLGWDTGTDAPWIWADDGEVDIVDVDLVALTVQLEAAIAAAAGVSAGPVLPGVEASWALASDTCPAWFTAEDGTPYWSDSCTTEAGARFEGYGGLTTYADYDDGAQIWQGFGLVVAGSVTAPEGAQLSSGGYSAYLEGVDRSGNWVAYSDLAAGTQWTGSALPYLQTGAAPHIAFYAVSSPDRSGGALSISAQIEAEAGLQAVIFDELLFVSEGWGSRCAEEPSGAISAFVAEGLWVDVEFDGASWGGEVEEALCDGCGRVSLEGLALGEVCLSFEPVRHLDDWGLWSRPPSASLRPD